MKFEYVHQQKQLSRFQKNNLVGLSMLLILFQNCSKIDVQDQVVFLSLLSVFSTYEDTPVRLKIQTRQSLEAILLNGQVGLVSSQTKNGTIENFNSTTGAFDYTPTRNFNGNDEVTVTAVLTDGRKVENSYPIEVIPVNDLPSAKDLFLETKIGEARTITLLDFFAIDEDNETPEFIAIDGNNAAFTATQQGTWGKLEKKVDPNGAVNYVHTTLSLGAKSHRFIIRDGSLAEVIVTATFSPENPIMAFKPALAVRDMSCIFCHATIKGNVISDFTATLNGHVGFRGIESNNKAGDYVYDEWADYGARSFLGTTFLEGTYYVPMLSLESASTEVASRLISQAKNTPMNELPKFGRNYSGSVTDGFTFIDGSAFVLMPSARDAVSTIGEWADTILNFRSETYIEQLRVLPGYKKSAESRAIASHREVVAIKIGHPVESDINELLKDSDTITYYKQGDDAADLKQFENFGTYFGNKPGEVMTCDGDLKLKTKYGCRIYATGSVFIEGHQASDNSSTALLNRPGIEYIDATAQSQLQITSARAIMMGLGKCSTTPGSGTNAEEGQFGRRITYDNQGFAPIGGLVKDDYYRIKNSSEGSVLQTDAGDCADRFDQRRSVSFEKLLLNAPRIDSRYTGNFKGVVIALNSIWSLGKFSYIYDNVFDAVPILPMISSDKFFKVTDCENNSEYSLVEKSASLKSCVIKTL